MKISSLDIRNNRLLVWIALTLASAGVMVAMFRWANSAWWIGGGALLLFLLTIRDRFEGGERLADREDELRQVAERLDFDFEEGKSSDLNVLGWSDSFRLTNRSQKTADVLDAIPFGGALFQMCYEVSNVMRRREKDGTLAVFDFCQPNPRHADTTLRQTVLALKSNELEFPHFAIAPTSFDARLSSRFRTDVNIRDGYRCYGEPPAGIQEELRSLSEVLEASFTLEAGDGCLLLYRDELANRDRTWLEDLEIDALVRQSLILYDRLVKTAEWPLADATDVNESSFCVKTQKRLECPSQRGKRGHPP